MTTFMPVQGVNKYQATINSRIGIDRIWKHGEALDIWVSVNRKNSKGETVEDMAVITLDAAGVERLVTHLNEALNELQG